jgi:uncharacterized protein (TIGR03067 family)
MRRFALLISLPRGQRAAAKKNHRAFPCASGPTPRTQARRDRQLNRDKHPLQMTPTERISTMFRAKLFLLSVPVLMLVPASALAQEKKGDAKKDQERCQGKWEMVSWVANGAALGPEVVKKTSLVVEGDKMTSTLPGQTPLTGSFKLDPSKSPAQIDLSFEDGLLKGLTVKGIYKLDGKSLTLCWGVPSGDRPTEFASKKGSQVDLKEFKRAK